MISRLIVPLLAMLTLGSCGGQSTPPRCSGVIVVISADKGETRPLERVLSEAGFQVTGSHVDDRDLSGLVKKADLVVMCGRPPEFKATWSQQHFGLVEGKKVLAVGPSGAHFLALGGLLIGMPHGWHNQHLPIRIQVPTTLKESSFKNLLKEPYPITPEKTSASYSTVTIVTGDSAGRESIGIYDGGVFPKGTLGIGLEESDLHHWLIAKQGNYVLWGAGIDGRCLTSEGKALFLNLCSAFIASSSEPLVFPEKNFLKAGETAAVLKGGHRNVYYVNPTTPGIYKLAVKWDGKHDMMLMTDVDRVDGRASLSTKWDVTKTDVGKPLMVEVGSFDLAEGVESPYTITLSGP